MLAGLRYAGTTIGRGWSVARTIDPVLRRYSTGQFLPADAEILQISEHRQGDLFGFEEGLRDPLHVAGGNRFDALHQLVQGEEPAEVHLLPRQVRHATGGR